MHKYISFIRGTWDGCDCEFFSILDGYRNSEFGFSYSFYLFIYLLSKELFLLVLNKNKSAHNE